MVRRGLTAILLGLAGLGSAWAAPAPDNLANAIDGSWNGEQAQGDAMPVAASLIFSRNGRVLTGRMRSGGDELPLFDVRETGGRVSFSLVIPGSPYVTVHYYGARTGDELRLVSPDEGQGVFTFTAHRDPAAIVAVAMPPIAAPPPAPAAAPVAAAPAPAPTTGAALAIAPTAPLPLRGTIATPAVSAAPAVPVAPVFTPTASLPPPPPQIVASLPPTPAPAAAPLPSPEPPLAGSIAGRWTAEQSDPNAETLAAVLTFTRNNGTLSGTLRSGMEETPLFELRETAASVSFTRVVPGTPYRVIRYSGTRMGDSLMLTSPDDGDGIYRLSATRDGAAPEAAPARIASLAPPAPPPPRVETPPPVTASLPPPVVSPPPAPPPPALATRAGGLDGNWSALQTSAGSAAPIEASLTFTGGRGQMQVGADDWPVFDVKRADDAVFFTLVIPGEPYVTIHYGGTVTGDRFEMASLDEGQGAFKLTARRVSATAPAPTPPPIAAAPPLPPAQTQVASAPPQAPIVAPPPPVIAPPAPPPVAPAPPPAPQASLQPPIAAPTARIDAAPSIVAPPIPPPAPPAPVASGPPVKLPLPPLRDLAANGLMKIPPMGWASRQRFGTEIDDATIRQAADGIDETPLKTAGYVYIELDEGWQGTRDARSVLRGNAKFPDMKALGDHIHARGLKFGLMTSAAPKSCNGFEGSYGHETEDARAFADWGVDFLVLDWCGAEAIYPTQGEQQAAYQKMAEALRASGRDIAFGISQDGAFNVGAWAVKAGANLWRTGKDVTDSWPSVTEAGFKQDTSSAPAQWADPGLVQIGNGGMSELEYRTHLNLWAVRGAPLMLGNDVRIMRPETVTLLTNREVIAVDQDAGGRQGKRIAQNGQTEVWAKPLADGSMAVAFFNRGDASAPVAVSWQQLGLEGPRQVRDLWWHENIGRADNRYVVFLTAHTSLLLRFAR